MILVAILDFVEGTEKRPKKLANSLGPICILQIFRNNLRRGFRVRAETSDGGQTQQKQLVSTTT